MLINSSGVNEATINGSAQVVIRASTEFEDPTLTYFFTITGTPDITIPVESVSIRRTLTDKYLSVVIPDITNIDAINARLSGEMYVTRTQTDRNGNTRSSEIVRTAIDNVTLYQGSRNASIVLDGHSVPDTVSAEGRTITGPTYRNIQNGFRRYRSRLDNYLRPGDTASVNGETFTVSEIVATINLFGETMEFAENSG